MAERAAGDEGVDARILGLGEDAHRVRDEVRAIDAEEVREEHVGVHSADERRGFLERRLERHHAAFSERPREQLGLMLCGKRRADFVEIPVHDVVDLVEREIDAVVGHAALREVVGADAIRPVARADEALPLRGLFLGRLLHLLLLDARGEHAPGLLAVLVLAAAVLALDHDARRKVREPHRRIGLVHVLAARAARAIRVDAHVRRD
jgi:hypothetical protein